MFGLKERIVAALPRRLKDRLKLYATYTRVLGNYFYDSRRFLSGSSSVNVPTNQEQLAALITMDYHRLEKGLALPDPRPGFGQPVAVRLIDNSRKYALRYGRDQLIDVVANVVREYRSFNRKHGVTADLVESFVNDYAGTGCLVGGTVKMSRENIWAMGKMDMRPFFASRYSVRNFTKEPVLLSDLEAAATMAQKTPSVCNRQCGRVYYVTAKEDIVRLLSYQNGNRGYGNRAGAVLLVSADVRTFATLGERNQAWIDGGLFAMSIAYALHSLGLGTCMLNWSVEKDQDKALRRAFLVPDYEVVIMMMAVGHLPEQLRVAQSPRRPLQSVLKPLPRA